MHCCVRNLDEMLGKSCALSKSVSYVPLVIYEKAGSASLSPQIGLMNELEAPR